MAAVSAPSTGSHVLSELERLLRQPECPACAYVEEVGAELLLLASDREFQRCRDAIAASRQHGDVPRVHSRRLVEEIGEGHVMTIVVREALAGARQAARGRGSSPPPAQPARRPIRRPARTPDGGRWIARSATCPAVLRARRRLPSAFRRGGTRCSSVEPEPARGPPPRSLGRKRGLGARHVARRRRSGRPRRAHGARAAGASRRRRIDDRGPATGSGPRHVRSAYRPRWRGATTFAGITERGSRNDPSLQNDPGELCAAHLNDLALVEPGSSRRKRSSTNARPGWQAARLLARLGEPPDRPAAGERSTRGRARPARGEFVSKPYCPPVTRATESSAPSSISWCGDRAPAGARALRAQPRAVPPARRAAPTGRRPGSRDAMSTGDWGCSRGRCARPLASTHGHTVTSPAVTSSKRGSGAGPDRRAGVRGALRRPVCPDPSRNPRDRDVRPT